jgi:HEAT repeat protein
MIESGNEVSRRNAVAKSPDYTVIKSLIDDLGNKGRVISAEARRSLVKIGEPAVGPLVESLASQNERVRWEVGKVLDDIKVVWSKHADATTISALVNDLGSEGGLVRVRARKSLVTIGAKAVGALANGLSDKKRSKRWEVAKALGQIGDPAATQALIRALEDKEFDVRWLAAEGLVAIGRRALEPLLLKLSERPDTIWMREGAHHFLHGIYRDKLRKIIRPVLIALEDVDAPLEVPFAAKKAIQSLGKAKSDVLSASSKGRPKRVAQ